MTVAQLSRNFFVKRNYLRMKYMMMKLVLLV
jgi:hypothetical protein